MQQRFATLRLRGDHALRNRVVVPPMCSETAATDGLATERTIQHYARLASSGASLVMVEYAFVHHSGRSEDNQLGIASDQHAEALRPVLAAIRQSGAKAGLQITHSGAKSARKFTGGELMSPSGIPVPVKDQELEVPDVMSTAEIDAWRSWFVAAAGRAVSLGFDAVELHAAHGYGLNQWISPITNRREDRYGGNSRHRLLAEIVTTIRALHPDVLLSVRMPGRDFSEGGLDVSDTTALAKTLEDLGVDLIHVSSGIGGWRRPSSRTGEGYLVDEAREIQRHVSAPVIGVGGIQSSQYIEEGLAEGWFRLAAVGRAILADPCAWGERNMRRACQPL